VDPTMAPARRCPSARWLTTSSSTLLADERRPLLPLKHVAAGLVLAATLSPVYGCAFFESRSKPHAEQHAIGALGAGFRRPQETACP
jgi:hypothetical protein